MGKMIDWRGTRRGMLTVIERMPSVPGDGPVRWRCACDCGGEIILESRAIKRGRILDCGCRKLKPNQNDLTGRRFGKLVCLSSTGISKPGAGVLWNCRCDCGSECQVPSQYLTGGLYKSCGCLSRPPLKDLTGQTFHRLTVLEYGGKKSGAHMWRCRCDCGNITLVRQDALRSGRVKSCGCISREAFEKARSESFVGGTSLYTLEYYRSHLNPNNTSGYNGVYRNKRTGRWVASGRFRGKAYYLGSYETAREAGEARRRFDEYVDGEIARLAEKKPEDEHGTVTPEGET